MNNNKNIITAHYSFVGFVHATGLSVQAAHFAYNDFYVYTAQYVKNNGAGAISESFESWISQTTLIDA